MRRPLLLKIGNLSLILDPRALIWVGVLLILVTLIAMLALTQGAYPVSNGEIWRALTGQADDTVRMIVMDHRLPRILVAIGAGAAFGMAGALFQTMLRNPLASPDMIGFSAGASCGALGAIMLFGSGLVLFGALVGGTLTAVLVTLVAWQGGLQPYRLILTGIGFSLTLGALSDLMMSRMDVLSAAEMAQWLVGTLNARDATDVVLIWVGLALLTPLVLWLQFPLARLSMDEDVAQSLGLPQPALRLAITVVGVALVALAVSVAGPLPFVSFVSGLIARRLVRHGHPALLASALVGAAVTLLADLLARTAVPGLQLPAGVFTAIIGAPVLMWLLMVQFRKGIQ